MERKTAIPELTVLARSVGLWIGSGQIRQVAVRSGMHSPQSGQKDKKLGAM